MPQIYNIARRALPSPTTDGSQVQNRGGRYGEGYTKQVGHDRYPLALEGSYYKAINPTPGTGIAQTIQTSFAATNGICSIYNSDSAGGKQISLDYVRLINTTVGASTTRSEMLMAVDNIQRWSSGGSQLTAVNANMDVATAAVGVVRFGALTLAAESGSVRRLSRAQLRTAIMVIYEEWLITFGGHNEVGTTVLGGTAAQRNVTDIGPAIIGPGHTLCLHLWNTANAATAPTWEVEVAWWER